MKWTFTLNKIYTVNCRPNCGVVGSSRNSGVGFRKISNRFFAVGEILSSSLSQDDDTWTPNFTKSAIESPSVSDAVLLSLWIVPPLDEAVLTWFRFPGNKNKLLPLSLLRSVRRRIDWTRASFTAFCLEKKFVDPNENGAAASKSAKTVLLLLPAFVVFNAGLWLCPELICLLNPSMWPTTDCLRVGLPGGISDVLLRRPDPSFGISNVLLRRPDPSFAAVPNDCDTTCSYCGLVHGIPAARKSFCLKSSLGAAISSL